MHHASAIADQKGFMARSQLHFAIIAAMLLPHPVLATGLVRRGPVVMPRTVTVSALPRMSAPANGVVRERPEPVTPGIDQELDRLKLHPRPPLPTEMGQLTVDAGTGPLAPVAGNGFEGITQAGWIPSEPTAAAGPLNVFTMGNVSITVTNKDGSNRVEVNGRVFFGIPTAEGDFSDPQCFYDAVRGRFVALAFTQGTSGANQWANFYLGISKTNDARGAWWVYKFDQTLDGTTPTGNWSDYEALGLSDDKIGMSSQQYSFSGNSYQYQKIRVVDRALAYSGGPVSYVDIVNFPAPPGGDLNDLFVTKVARNLSAGDSTLHCLNVRTNGGTRVTYRAVTGPPSSPTLSAGVLVSCAAYSVPPDAAQSGSTKLVATNDCRPADFYVRNGVLTIAWHSGISFGGSVSCVRLFRLRTSDTTVLTDETYAASGTFLYYPAVTVDSVGTIYLGFDRSSATEFSSAWATGKRRSDATLEPAVLLKAGVSATTQSRWGDYTGIDNDAAASGPGGSVAWYAGQWVKGSNTFGTWINRLTFTYGQVAGTVLDDCDGAAGTTGDRSPLAGVTVALKQGATTLATAVTDSGGSYNFGWLESGTYDVVVTPPPSGVAVDAITGSGGTAQTRVSATDLQVGLTNAQTSSGNQFVVTSSRPVPVAAGIAPASVQSGSAGFTLTVNGSAFSRCAQVRLDGTPRTTTWVGLAQLTATIAAADVAAPGIHVITVFTPPPGGGTSNPETLTVAAPPDSFSVTVNVNGHGTVSRSPDQPRYPSGASVTLTATPAAGCAFSGWSGDTTTAGNPLVLVMNANHTVTAAFVDTMPPAVHVTAPAAGETLTVGTQASLVWSATDNIGVATVDVLLSRSGPGGPFDPLATGIANSGTFTWTVTGPSTATAFVEVVAHDSTALTASDVSDSAFVIAGGATAVEGSAPSVLTLAGIVPHPVHGSARIRFTLAATTALHMTVLDVQGREVALLADGTYGPGAHEVLWRDPGVPAGLYFLRMRAGDRTLVQRIVRVR